MIHHAKIRISIVLSLTLILLCQIAFIPIALSIIFAISIGCLWFNLKRNLTLPKVWNLVLVALALGSVYFSYRSFIGVEAGVAVLSVFLFAKALETTNKRDLLILFNFALFVAASSFLFSQSFFMAVGILVCLLSCFLGLYRIQSSEFEQGLQSQQHALKQDAKHVGKFILYAVPFFIILFIFFPRLPPLWYIPIPENKGVTGISDTMSPGDIAELSQSSALAFRIIGDVSRLPPRSELYWRALVLDEYDGQTWTSSFVNQQPMRFNETDIQKLQTGWDYQYLASDPSVRWIMGLEKSVPLERRYYNRLDWGIVPHRLTQRVEPIQLRWLNQDVEPAIQNPEWIERINIKIQANFDQKSQELATELFAKSGENPERYIQNVLNWYRQQQFVYTLTPGRLGQNRVDDFLFNSRQGFCEHYASSFAMLMRYVGIPARIVTGYQGGELAPDAKSWEVRQLDAHAWTEVLLHGQWIRIDPTAIIAPQRIDNGMQNLMSEDRRIFGDGGDWTSQQYAMLTKLRIWSDYASYQWQSKVIGYNADSQKSWLSKFGLSSSYATAIILIVSILALMVAYFVWIQLQKRKLMSEIEREIQRFNRQLPSVLKRAHAETFKQWMNRIAPVTDQPEKFVEIIHLFEQSEYSGRSLNEKELNQFKDLLKNCAHVIKNEGKHLS